MDRLPSLMLGALVVLVVPATACDDTPAVAPPSRVVAVQATERRVDPRRELCEVAKDGDEAPMLAFPALADGERAPDVRAERWLNVWATWCRPCVEEMPMLVRFHERMTAEGQPFALDFVSVDESREAIDAFRESHADVPESLRIADPSTVAAWATSVGLDEGATLPIHVLTDATGRVRCARTGAISERDLSLVEEALREL